MAAEQQKPKQEMSPSEDEQCNVYLCYPHHEGVTNISRNIDVTISTCTAEQAFSLPQPHISDGNHELSIDVVTDLFILHLSLHLTLIFVVWMDILGLGNNFMVSHPRQ